MKERASDLSPERQAAVARALGIGAVKYADLSTERMRDYVFDWDRMLAFEGNTGPVPAVRARPHPLHLPPRPRSAPPAARARCRCSASPRARAGAAAAALRRGGRGDGGDAQPVEALHLPLRPGHHVHRRSTRPAGSWSSDEAVRTSRLGLCDLTARVLELGLSLLGMEAPEQM